MDQEEVIVQKTTNSRTEKTMANIQPFRPNRAVGLGNKGFVIWPEPNISLGIKLGIPGLSLIAGGQGFSPATKRVAPSYFYWKIEEK